MRKKGVKIRHGCEGGWDKDEAGQIEGYGAEPEPCSRELWDEDCGLSELAKDAFAQIKER